MISLLGKKGFFYFLIVLVFNAMTDIAHKITIQNILIKCFSEDMLIIQSVIVNALILIPFILLFSPSGHISDKFNKAKVVRYAAFSGIVLALTATLSYYMGWFYAAFGITFLLAAQSAIYSPAKYGLIKELAGGDRLAEANGLVQALTIAAILGSALLFSWLFESMYDMQKNPDEILRSIAPIGWLLTAMSSAEFLFSLLIPVIKEPEDKKRVFRITEYIKLNYLKKNMQIIKSDENIWLSIIGLGIFWGLSQLIVAVFPTHYKAVTGDENTIIIQGLLALSAIGIIIGSLYAGKFSRLHIELGIVPIGSIGIFVSLLMLAYVHDPFFMAVASLMFGFSGALAIVPLNATIQFLSPEKQLGTILAGNNFIQNIFMLLSLTGTVVLVGLGFSSKGIFYTTSLLVLFATVYSIGKLPQLTARLMLLPILRTRYRMLVGGVENLPQNGGVLLLGNHISWIDWLVLQIASPRTIKFVMDKTIYDNSRAKWILRRLNMIPISGRFGKSAIEEVRKRLENGEAVALFPEGRISYNGQLGEFKKGFELIMKEMNVPIVPFYIHGLWGSTFSRANKHYKIISRYGARREVGIYFGKPMSSDSSSHQVKQSVKELSIKAWTKSINGMKPIQYQWLKRCKEGPFRRSMSDSSGVSMRRAETLTAVLLLAGALKTILKNEDRIGIILPASVFGGIVNMTLLSMGKKSVNLNYTLSAEAVASAIEQADIKTVISSEKFINRLSAKGFNPLSGTNVDLLKLEDLFKDVKRIKRYFYLFVSLTLPAKLTELIFFKKTSLDDTATILFSSGSESSPKGIELSHKNILGNIKQIGAMLNFQDDDAILNSLPIFHSFGLTVTTLLPLSEGIPSISVPDPTDAYSVGKMAYRHKATIMFGTSTFYRIYTKSRKVHPLMFSSVRMAVAGAEKLNRETAEAFKNKFGIEIYEGYGATETSPVISVNMPDMLDPDNFRVITGKKENSVGQALPGTVIRICDPQTLEELPVGDDGMILVGGIQVMKGYLNNEKKNRELLKEIDSLKYYVTGDKGHLDEDGFIYIVDRYSRFVKIGGEMISLSAIEDLAEKATENLVETVAVSLPDPKKGEIVMLLFSGEMNTEDFKEKMKISDIPAIMRPAHICKIETLPKLASGKTDFASARKIALALNKEKKD